MKETVRRGGVKRPRGETAWSGGTANRTVCVVRSQKQHGDADKASRKLHAAHMRGADAACLTMIDSPNEVTDSSSRRA